MYPASIYCQCGGGGLSRMVWGRRIDEQRYLSTIVYLGSHGDPVENSYQKSKKSIRPQPQLPIMPIRRKKISVITSKPPTLSNIESFIS